MNYGSKVVRNIIQSYFEKRKFRRKDQVIASVFYYMVCNVRQESVGVRDKTTTYVVSITPFTPMARSGLLPG